MQNAYAADLVTMIVELEEEGWSGVASTDVAVFVRSVVTPGFYIVPHEVGHLLGAGHDRLTCGEYGSVNCGATYPYSYGHRFDAEEVTYKTIMCYRPGVNIPYFSNPDVLFLGSPTGVAEGAANAADNARVINLEARAAANLRQVMNRFGCSAATYEVLENGGQLEVDVVRLGDTNTAASVTFETVEAAATSGQDFEAVSVDLAFGSGETKKTITLNILEDDQAEGPEHFIVSLSNPSIGSALGLRSSATVTIHDDEPGLSFVTTNVVVLESVPQNEVIVRRTGRTDRQASVRCLVSGGTASKGVDFDLLSERLEFAAGDIEKALVFAPIDDGLIESDKTCELFLTEAEGAIAVSPVRAVVRILDDDRPGSVDPLFNQGSSPSAWVVALTLRPDQRILCGGWFTEVGGAIRTALVQYLPDGEVDPSFAPVEFRESRSAEAQVNPAAVYRVALQDDGKILVGGSFASVNGYARNHVVRLMPEGTLDESFVLAPGPNSPVWDVLQQPDGRILIAGSFRSVSGWESGLIARLNRDGSVDESFQDPQTGWCRPTRDGHSRRGASDRWSFLHTTTEAVSSQFRLSL